MYYAVVGRLRESNDEEWNPEIIIDFCFATLVAPDERQIEVMAQRVTTMGHGFSYFIPQKFYGRIYNNTANDIVLSDTATICWKSKIEAGSLSREGYEITD